MSRFEPLKALSALGAMVNGLRAGPGAMSDGAQRDTPGEPPRDLRGLSQALRRHLAWAVVFSAGINLLYLAPSLYMLQVYDRVLVSGSGLTLLLLSVVAIFALVCLAGLDSVRSRLMGRIALRLDLRMAPAILRGDLEARGEGRAASGVTGMRDLDVLRQTIASPATSSVFDLPWTPLFILICFLIHPAIAAAALVGALALVGLALANEAASSAPLKLVAERAPTFYGGLEGDMRAAETIRALGGAEPLVRRRLKEREQLLSAQTGAAFVAADYTAATKFVRMALQSGMLGLGAYLALRQEISAGAIIAATILSARAFAPIEQIVAGWRQLAQGRIALASLLSLLGKAEARPVARTALPAPEGAVTLEGVGARAPGSERVVLANISLRAEPGRIVGIVGASGAGKSTLARILANAASPAAGQVRIDGAAYRDWAPEALARHVGYLPQNIDLAPGTVAENIARFREPPAEGPAALDAMIVEAAKQAGAHDLILRLPEGYDTKLGPSGRGLSMGQGQRIALARALFGAPHLLVLDEPNAHLDAEGEAALVGALRQHRGRGGVAFVVAHRAGVMAAMDMLAVLQDGRLVEYGPRDEVAARLAKAQAARGDQP